MVMVFSIQRYSCQICLKEYATYDEAEACEDQGLPPTVLPNTIFAPGDPAVRHLTFTSPIVFCSDRNYIYGHFNTHKSYACRDNGYTDNIDAHCSTKEFLPLDHKNVPDPDWDCFQRMVQWMQSQNRPVHVWNGTEAIPLVDFMRDKDVELD